MSLKQLKQLRPWALAIGLATAAAAGWAVEMPISATDTLAKLQQPNSQVLFVDVRDPVEIMLIGGTDVAHVNVPFLLINRQQWDDKRGIFALEPNPDFVAQLERELARRGLGKDAEIITLCRSGNDRGEPSAAFLRANGFANARYVVHGFQGDARKDGPQKGMRTLNGWQNSGLPWSSKLNPDKVFRVDRH